MNESVIGVGLQLADGPADPRAVGDAILRFYGAVGSEPERISYRAPRAKQRSFTRRTFEEVVLDERVPEIAVYSTSENTPRVRCFLRFVPEPDAPLKADFERRWFGVFAQSNPAVLVGPIRTLIEEIERVCVVVQGCSAGFISLDAAENECCLGQSPPGAIVEATRLRLKEDSLSFSPKNPVLRRLYPITIIGHDLWAKLPPLPSVDPQPLVEDLGECKMVTAWPTLCAPRDPEFLHGTRALREWLWPFTIKNPADHVDNDPPVVGSSSANAHEK